MCFPLDSCRSLGLSVCVSVCESVLCGSLLLGDREAGRNETKDYTHYVKFLTNVRQAVGMDQATEVAVVRNRKTKQHAFAGNDARTHALCSPARPVSHLLSLFILLCCYCVVQLKMETEVGINMIAALRRVYSAMFWEANRASVHGQIGPTLQPPAPIPGSKQTDEQQS